MSPLCYDRGRKLPLVAHLLAQADLGGRGLVGMPLVSAACPFSVPSTPLTKGGMLRLVGNSRIAGATSSRSGEESNQNNSQGEEQQGFLLA